MQTRHLSAKSMTGSKCLDCFDFEGIEKEEVTEVYMGNVVQTSLGQNPARQAAIFAGLSSAICCRHSCTQRQ